MKKNLIALSLLAATGLLADNGCCPEPCPQPCQPVCCTPCCVPQPRRCINCECYNPPFYILQCDWGLFADVEFLYWYAREADLEFGELHQFWGYQSSALGVNVQQEEFPLEHLNVKTKWDPGVRVGLGWNIGCDAWDLYLNWTYFKNTAKGSASIGIDEFNNAGYTEDLGANLRTLVDPWNQSNNINLSEGNEASLSAKWSVTFNQIDLELGKKYWVSRCFNMRPYIGLRGAWTKTHFNVLGDGSTPLTVPPTQEGRNILTEGPFTANDFNFITNKLWGVGILGGIQPNFRLGSFCGCGEFSIYGNFETALIWGRFESKNSQPFNASFPRTITTPDGVKHNADVSQSASPIDHESVHRMSGIIDVAIGLRWEEYWCCDRYLTTIDLGWEHHYWWKFGLYHRVTSTFTDRTGDPSRITINNTQNITTDLGYGGFVLRARFDF